MKIINRNPNLLIQVVSLQTKQPIRARVLIASLDNNAVLRHVIQEDTIIANGICDNNGELFVSNYSNKQVGLVLLRVRLADEYSGIYYLPFQAVVDLSEFHSQFNDGNLVTVQVALRVDLVWPI